MSGYLQKTADQQAVACVQWDQGYLEPDEYIDGDMGWSVEPLACADEVCLERQTFDSLGSQARVSKGVPGRVYMMSVRASTNRGRILERAIVLRIAEDAQIDAGLDAAMDDGFFGVAA